MSRWSALGASVLLLSTSAAAEETSLTLQQALDMASQANPEVSAARERSSAQAARAEAVGRVRWPRLTLSSGWSWTDTPAAVFAEKLNAGEFTAEDFAIDSLNDPAGLAHLGSVLALEAPLDVFGRVGALRDQQAAFSRAATAQASETAQEVRLRVVEAYWRAAVARRAVAVTEGAVAGAVAREKDVEARVTAGSALGADLLRARARRREREADLATKRGEARIAEAGLRRLLGAAPDQDFLPSDPVPAPPPLQGTEAEWVAKAEAARPLLAAVRDHLEGAQRGIDAAKRDAYPELGVRAQIQDDRLGWSSGRLSSAVGAQLRWSPFDAARGKRTAAAAAEARAAEQDLRGAQDEVRLEVETAFRRAEAAREARAAAAGGAAEGREALRVIQERRQAGVATLTDELETEAASLAAELRELQAAAEAAIADAALARAAGEL